MTGALASPAFRVGDHVRLRDKRANVVWRVAADDTNRTPVHDPEPAYKLARGGACSPLIRYAYESDLELAE